MADGSRRLGQILGKALAPTARPPPRPEVLAGCWGLNIGSCGGIAGSTAARGIAPARHDIASYRRGDRPFIRYDRARWPVSKPAARF